MALFAFGAVLVLGAGLLVLRAQALRGAAADEVAAALGRALGLKARVGRTELSLLGLSLHAFDVQLDGQRGPLLRARELRVSPSFGALLRGRVDLRALELRGAELVLRSDDLPQSVLAPGQDFAFGTLSVPDARVRVDAGEFGSLTLERAQLELSASGKTLQLTLEAERGELAHGSARKALTKLELGASLEPAALNIAKARVEGAGLSLSVTDGAFVRPLGGGGRAQVAFDAELADLARLFARGALPEAHGRVRGSGALALAQSGLALDGKLTLEGGRLAGAPLPARIELALHADAAGTQVRGALPLAGAQQPLAFVARPRLAGSGLALDALELRCAGSVLRGQAELGQNGALTLSIAGDQVELAEVAPLFGKQLAALAPRGRGRLELAAKGTLAAPELQAQLALENARVGSLELGKAAFALAVEQNGSLLRFERAELLDAERRLSADGLRITLADGVSEASAKLRITSLPLRELYRLIGAAEDPLLARLSAGARGSASLEFSRKRGEQVELALDLSAPSLDGYRFDNGRLEARVSTPDVARGWKAGVLSLRKLALRAQNGSFELDGELPSSGALDLRVALARLPLERMAFVTQHARGLEGRVSGSGRLTGSSGDPRAALELTFDELRAGSEHLGRARATALLRGRGDGAAAGIDSCRAGAEALASGAVGGSGWLLCGQGPGERVRFDLALGTAQGLPVRGTLVFAGVDLAPLLPETRPGQRVAGTLEGTLRIGDGSSLVAPEQASGTLKVQKLALGQGDRTLASSAPFELALKHGALAMVGGAAELVSGDTRLSLSAGGKLGKDAHLGASGKVEARVLLAAIPGVRNIFGRADVALELAAQLPATLRGRADLRDVILELAPGVYVRKLQGKLTLDGRNARVEDAQAEFGGGMLRASGKLALSGLAPESYALKLVAEDVTFEPQPRFELALDADTELDWPGAGKPPRLKGRVRLKRAVYGRHIELPEALIALNKSERESLAGYSAARDRLALDLTLEHDQPLQIRNNFLDAEVAAGGDGKLRIVGTDQRLGLIGKLKIVRGRVLFRGDEFKVTQGEIAFDDKQRVAPRFDVQAVADKRKKRKDASIVFAAHGNRDAFDVRVSCDAADAPRPFTCDFARNRFRCDSFEQLVQLWVCKPTSELSAR